MVSDDKNKIRGYFRYWGKADQKYLGETKWHPLAYHSLDVAACTHTLLFKHDDWLTKISACSSLTDNALRKWLPFLGGIHDAGKFGNGFQQQRLDLQLILHGKSTMASSATRHDTMGYELLMQLLPDCLKRKDLSKRGGMLIRSWVAAAAGHHGRPPRNDSSWALMQRDNFPDDVTEDVKQYVEDIKSLLLSDGCPVPEGGHDLSGQYKRASWLLAGILVIADWLGSNTKWFPYRGPDLMLAEYWRDVALPNAEKAVTESGVAKPRIAVIGGIKTLFKKIDELTPLQKWTQSVKIARTPQLFILEELTGGGKTEAAISLASRLLSEGLGSGAYIALPTMATADAMFDRIRECEVYKNIFADRASLALAHSADRLKFALEESNRKDSGYTREEGESASQHCTEWLSDNRKKALLADFGIGTIDQALLSVLSAKHQSLRLLGLSAKVLIVDEVHACDAYVGELLCKLLSFHAALGGSAILLSATLPQNQKKNLIDAFASGVECAPDAPANWDYPLATHWHAHSDNELETHIEARKEVSRSVGVDIICDEKDVVDRLEIAINKSCCVVWIRNTVVDAVDVWHAWCKKHPDNPAILFHARYALVDRLRIGKDIERLFGRNSTQAGRKGKLVIANQVIEQSLDVDFDDMVTDLAPIDLLIQRAGRLQRHIRDPSGNRLTGIGKDDGRGGAKIGVFMPVPIIDAPPDWYKRLFPKASFVYPDHARLWLTAYWLAAHHRFELPRQAREMIETVYGGYGGLEIPPGLENSEIKAMGDRSAGRSLADLNALNFESGYKATGLHWNEDDNAPTRLGEASVRIRLSKITNKGLIPWAGTNTGMEWALSELTVPKRLVTGESQRHFDLIKKARTTMPDEGKYCIIVALEKTGSGRNWHGFAVDRNGVEKMINYSQITGLTFEKGVNDESDL